MGGGKERGGQSDGRGQRERGTGRSEGAKRERDRVMGEGKEREGQGDGKGQRERGTE